MKTIFFFILLGLSAPAFGQSCADLQTDSLYQELLQQLQQDEAENRQALGFRLYNYPIVFTGESGPLCAALYLNGKIDYINLEAPLEFRNGYYTFRNSHNPLSAHNEAQLQEIIVNREIGTFLIFNVKRGISDHFDGPSNSVRVYYAFLVHEGFHFLEQGSYFNPSHLSPGLPYIGWSDQGREFIRQNCYNSTEDVLNKTEQELTLLKEALRLSYLENSRPEAFEKIRQFLNVRNQRYELLRDRLFHPEPWDEAETCAHGEAFMEYQEGTADFVEHQYLFNAGLLLIEEYLTYDFSLYRGGSEYYTLGSLQLLLIQKWDPDFQSFQQQIRNGGIPPALSVYTMRLQSLVN